MPKIYPIYLSFGNTDVQRPVAFLFLPVFRSGGKLPRIGLTASIYENGTQLRLAMRAAPDLLVRKHALQKLQCAGSLDPRDIPPLAQQIPGFVKFLKTVGMK